MILWDRVKKSLDNGVEQVVRVSKALSERAKIETAVARLLIDKGNLESKEERAYRRLGERVSFLWEQKSEGIMEDHETMEILGELAVLREEIEQVKEKIRKASLGEEAA